MHPDPIIRRLHCAVEANVAAMLWSPPGAGKTARVFAYAIAMGLSCERWPLSQCEPIDVRPRVLANGTYTVIDAPEVARLRAAGGGILFADELNRADKATEGAALTIFDYPPPGTRIIAAGNPPSRGQSARILDAATANRFLHLTVDADHKAYASACINGWQSDSASLTRPSEASIAKHTQRAAIVLSSFVRKRPELLEKCPDNPAQAGGAWPSTRSWDNARKVYGMALAMGLDTEDVLAVVGGCVGDGPATEFLAYASEEDLIDPEEALAAPDKFTPATGRIDRTVSALTAIASAVRQQCTEARWLAAWRIIARCVECGQADAGMVGAELLIGVHRSAKVSGLTPFRKLIPTRMAHIIVSDAAGVKAAES